MRLSTRQTDGNTNKDPQRVDPRTGRGIEHGTLPQGLVCSNNTEGEHHLPVDISMSCMGSLSCAGSCAASTWICGIAGGASDSSSSAIVPRRSCWAAGSSAARPLNHPTDSLFDRDDGFGSIAGGTARSNVGAAGSGAGGDGVRGVAEMCGGGATSPMTLPDTGGALRSFVWALRSLAPPWMALNKALRSPVGAGAAMGAAEAAGAGGGGGTPGGGGGGGGGAPVKASSKVGGADGGGGGAGAGGAGGAGVDDCEGTDCVGAAD